MPDGPTRLAGGATGVSPVRPRGPARLATN